jgi:hypothetical protein
VFVVIGFVVWLRDARTVVDVTEDPNDRRDEQAVPA